MAGVQLTFVRAGLARLIVLMMALGSIGAAPADPVAELQRQISERKTSLGFDGSHGYLKSVLAALKVPIDSQGLVFSKTSLQASRISPQAPRALYFNDDVYVGWVQGAENLEIASVDPLQGPVFYLLRQSKSERPVFLRQDSTCLQCHQSPATHDVPGLLMRSVYPDHGGMPVFSAGTFSTTEQSPMKQRWGGWYLDGKGGDLGMGNATVTDIGNPENLVPVTTELSAQFDTSRYLTPHSDSVALLVLAHQTHMHNLLTQAASETRSALIQEEAIRQAMGGNGSAGHLASTLTRLRSACEPVVRCMLFSGEAPLGGPLSGSTDFARHFEQAGPFDRAGRSLRQFELKSRIFRYPCSYLIYSPQFDALPAEAKSYIYRRMWKILTGRDSSARFANVSDADREAIYQILRDTKKDLPRYWKADAGG